MSKPESTVPGDDEFMPPNPEEMQGALFGQLVMQLSNMAMMLLGKTPHPQTGQRMRDLDAARLFIDQLEMLEIKTKGNLTADEQSLLKQNLMGLHLAFVEAAETPAPANQAEPQPATGATSGAENKPAAPSGGDSRVEAESQKRFTKKY